MYCYCYLLIIFDTMLKYLWYLYYWIKTMKHTKKNVSLMSEKQLKLTTHSFCLGKLQISNVRQGWGLSSRCVSCPNFWARRRLSMSAWCQSPSPRSTLISVYTPTMQYPDKVYSQLITAIDTVPKNDKLIILANCNARVGADTHWQI